MADMNEALAAMELSLRAIIRDEMVKSFSKTIRDYADCMSAEWASVVSQGALDKPWFDDAVHAEALAAVDDNKTSEDRTAAWEQAVVGSVIDSYRFSDWLSDQVQDTVRDMSFSVSAD